MEQKELIIVAHLQKAIHASNKFIIMKYIIVTILLMLSTFSNAQPNSNTIKFGVYFGGICQDGTTCGEWLIKPYSTFIFAKFEGEIIKNIGSGT